VNTEGSVVRTSLENYSLSLSGNTQAADGMRLDRGRSFSAAKISELLSAEKFNAEADSIIASLAALRAAPVWMTSTRARPLFSGCGR